MAYLEDKLASGEASAETTALPEVLMLGDSIRQGYTPFVTEMLSGKIDIKAPRENCRHTTHALVEMNNWCALVGKAPAVVCFNFGHWDVAHWSGEEYSLNSIETYASNLVRIAKRLRAKFPDTKLVFMTTCPMNPNLSIGVNPRTREEILAYNQAACKALEGLCDHFDDLYALTEDWGEEWYADYCHFTPAGFKRIAEHVAQTLQALCR